MFNEVQTLLQRITEAGAHDAIHHATNDHIQAMDGFDVKEQLQAAGDHALHDGDVRAAAKLRDLLSGPISYGENLKQNAVLLISHTPGVLKHFSPEFSRGILARM